MEMSATITPSALPQASVCEPLPWLQGCGQLSHCHDTLSLKVSPLELVLTMFQARHLPQWPRSCPTPVFWGYHSSSMTSTPDSGNPEIADLNQAPESLIVLF